MSSDTVHFPQITRIFSAVPWGAVGAWGLRIFLWGALVAFLVLNLIAAKNYPSKLSQILLPPLTHPFSVTQHVMTAKNLWDAGYQKTATRELVIAKDLIESEGSVLSATNNPTTLLNRWEQEPSKLKATYEYWKHVTQQQPEYRDGFLVAGAYAYQLGHINEAKQYFQKAYDIDPNYQATVEIIKKTENN